MPNLLDTLLEQSWYKKPGYWTHHDCPDSRITVMGERWWHTAYSGTKLTGDGKWVPTRGEMGSGRGDATLRKHLGVWKRMSSMAGGS